MAAKDKAPNLQQRIDRLRLGAPILTDTDIANAKRLAARHGRDLKFTPKRGPDTLGRLIVECCEVRPLAQVKSSSLFKRYQEFCEQGGDRWMPAKDFPAEVERRGFTYKRGTCGTRFYHGIEPRSEAQPWSE